MCLLLFLFIVIVYDVRLTADGAWRHHRYRRNVKEIVFFLLTPCGSAWTNASYLLVIDRIHSVASVVAAINRVRSDSTNQMQENILYLCLLSSWIEDPLRIFSKNHNKQPESVSATSTSAIFRAKMLDTVVSSKENINPLRDVRCYF